MSIATKTMTKFLKSFKKDNFCYFFNMIKEDKSLIFAFPLKIEAFSLFCLLIYQFKLHCLIKFLASFLNKHTLILW